MTDEMENNTLREAPQRDEMIEQYGFELGNRLYQIAWKRWMEAQNEMISKLAVELRRSAYKLEAILKREKLGRMP